MKKLVLINESWKLCFLTYMCFFVQSTVVTCADINYLDSTIRNYFADTRHHDPQFRVYKERAKEFIFNEFQKFGLDTEYHNFNVNYNNKVFTNVIGVLKGNNFGKESDKILGILAHYDTVSTTKGVDDNGAGVAAILEVARQLHKQNITREHTVLFVSPDLEEDGLTGSRHFIQQWLPMWSDKHYGGPYAVLNTTQGFIVLDTMLDYNNTDNSQKLSLEAKLVFQNFFPDTMTSVAADGFEGDFLSLISRKTPDAALAEHFKRSGLAEGRESYEIESFELPVDEGLPKGVHLQYFSDFLRSDHTNFWKENIPAIFITDTANLRGDMVKCYHHPCDNLDTMLTDDNLQFLGKTADSLVRTINGMVMNDVSRGGSRIPCIPTIIVAVILSVVLLHQE